MESISVVIPVYGCPKALVVLTERLSKTLRNITEQYEIIYVNDGCPLDSWLHISKIFVDNLNIVGINLSRNFGQHNAISAGLHQAKYEWVVVMDCDLQDQPEEIPKLLKKAHAGYDVVLAQRTLRDDNFIKKLSSKIFYTILSYLTDSKIDSSLSNFGIYHRRVVDVFLRMKERSSVFSLLVRWMGFKIGFSSVVHNRRYTGSSSYTIRKLFHTAFDIIISFSDKPLWLIIKLGGLISLVSFSFSVYFFLKWLSADQVLVGWTSLIISIWFLGGILMMILGIIGIYLAKVFEETKERPNYIIKELLEYNSKN